MAIRHEGVTGSVNDQMNAVHANVLTEDGFLLRTCEHGVRHPVGRLRGVLADNYRARRHEVKGEHDSLRSVACCEHTCCQGWNAHG